MILDKIGIFNCNKKPENQKVIQQLFDEMGKNGYNFTVWPSDECSYKDIDCQSRDSVLKSSTMLMVLGGDGALLRSAREASSYNLPILGVNFGKLGFLTETEISNLPFLLDRLKNNDFITEKRPMLSATYQGREISALNEIAIDKGHSPRIIRLDVHINERYFSTYTSDGLLISTPTGSTAYNLSAGGPLLQPDVEALILTPLNPHALAMRPLLIPDSSRLRIVVRSEHGLAVLSGDGQESINITDESEIQISRHADSVTFIRFAESDFYSLLRNKLGWGGFCDKTK